MVRLADIVIPIVADNNASPELQRLDGDLEQTESTANRLSGVALPGLAAGVGIVGSAIVANTARYTAHVQELTRISRSTGVAVVELQGLQRVFERAGFDGSDLNAILAETSIKIGDLENEARSGGGALTDVFDELNLSIEQLRNLSADQALLTIRQALDGIDTERRTHLADAIFGGEDGLRVLQIGTNQLRNARRELNEGGGLISQQSINNANRWNEIMGTFGTVTEGAMNQAGAAVVDTFLPFLEGVGVAVGILPRDVERAMMAVQSAVSDAEIPAGAQATILGEAIRVGIITPIQAATVDTKAELDGIIALLDDYAERSKNLLTASFGASLSPDLLNAPFAGSGGETIDVLGSGSSFQALLAEEIQREVDAGRRASPTASASGAGYGLREIERQESIALQKERDRVAAERAEGIRIARQQERARVAAEIGRQRRIEAGIQRANAVFGGEAISFPGSGGGGYGTSISGGAGNDVVINIGPFIFNGIPLADAADFERAVTRAIQTERAPLLEAVRSGQDCA